MSQYGFVRVAAAVPSVRVGDCGHNGGRVIDLMDRAAAEDVQVLVFPELCLTGYTCGDLFHLPTLLDSASQALQAVVDATATGFAGLAFVGVPVHCGNRLYNCAAAISQGQVLGYVPKSYLPNYKEFYECRWFAPRGVSANEVEGTSPTILRDRLFAAEGAEGLVVGAEVCEDLWVPIPPSSRQALAGATILVNLSASNEVIGKAAYRRQLVASQSGRCIAAYIYASCGAGESTTDVVYGGHCLIAENGVILAESTRFSTEETLLVADVDLQRLRVERMRTNTFGENAMDCPTARAFEVVDFDMPMAESPGKLQRTVEAHPFVPSGQETLSQRCWEIFQTQVAGLAKRLEYIGKPAVAIGVSGGLDSTLALLVTCKTFDRLGVPRSKIQGITMPGYGTTSRTKCNAVALMRQLRVAPREMDIRQLCLDEMRLLGHAPFGIALEGLTVETLTARLQQIPAEKRCDLVFENVQARMRTSLLMNAGFVVGTGDLSEAALGWSTYNGDHASMYNPNASIPKTLVKFLVSWAAENEFGGEARRVLLDVVATGISPELLPTTSDGDSVQSTESAIGPYELHDFFLFHFLRYGAPPEKILYLATQATFDKTYTADELRNWLQVFIKRFFGNQFKRSFYPDGPKVGTISLSPRGDWRMPSDAAAAAFLEWAE
jgi:NAD+ synthase (glutamine-hydrolysing)